MIDQEHDESDVDDDDLYLILISHSALSSGVITSITGLTLNIYFIDCINPTQEAGS